MTTANAEKKLAKLTGEKVLRDGRTSYVIYKGHVVSFGNQRNNGEETASMFHTRRVNDHSDPMTDYFAGTFHKNLNQAIRFID